MPNIPQNVAPEANAVEADVIQDWIARLKQARDTVKMAKEIEEECKDKIAGFLAEREAEYGTVNGVPVIRSQEVTRRNSPSVAIMEKVAPEILEKWGKTTVFTTISFVRD